MLSIGGFPTRHCEGFSRRAFLRASGSLPLALGLPEIIAAATPPEGGKAKSVLLVWLWGGPSHLDMFDPKPDAPAEVRGPFATIPTRTSGMRFTELFPKIAARSNLFSVIRSNVNHHGGHLQAGSIGLTGSRKEVLATNERGGPDPAGHAPNFGSIVSRYRPSESMPSFVSIARGGIGDGTGPMKGYGGGKWGSAYDPMLVSCSEESKVDIPSLKLVDGLSPSRLGERGTLLHELDSLKRQVETTAAREWDALHDRALALLTSEEAYRAFDVSREPQKVREAYGHTAFGQSCLLGRRLVEAGVPYVQVNWSQFVEVLFRFSDYGWDTHADNFELMADWHGPLLDRVFSTLLDDLKERGLFESTLVVCLGEFGRTPRINGIGSRDHWHQCYSSIWAGAGVEPGRVIGESDRYAEHPITDPITPSDVGTTILELTGIGTQDRAELRVLPEGRVIHELL